MILNIIVAMFHACLLPTFDYHRNSLLVAAFVRPVHICTKYVDDEQLFQRSPMMTGRMNTSQIYGSNGQNGLSREEIERRSREFRKSVQSASSQCHQQRTSKSYARARSYHRNKTLRTTAQKKIISDHDSYQNVNTYANSQEYLPKSPDGFEAKSAAFRASIKDGTTIHPILPPTVNRKAQEIHHQNPNELNAEFLRKSQDGFEAKSAAFRASIKHCTTIHPVLPPIANNKAQEIHYQNPNKQNTENRNVFEEDCSSFVANAAVTSGFQETLPKGLDGFEAKSSVFRDGIKSGTTIHPVLPTSAQQTNQIDASNVRGNTGSFEKIISKSQNVRNRYVPNESSVSFGTNTVRMSQVDSLPKSRDGFEAKSSVFRASIRDGTTIHPILPPTECKTSQHVHEKAPKNSRRKNMECFERRESEGNQKSMYKNEMSLGTRFVNAGHSENSPKHSDSCEAKSCAFRASIHDGTSVHPILPPIENVKRERDYQQSSVNHSQFETDGYVSSDYNEDLPKSPDGFEAKSAAFRASIQSGTTIHPILPPTKCSLKKGKNNDLKNDINLNKANSRARSQFLSKTSLNVHRISSTPQTSKINMDKASESELYDDLE